MLKSYLFNYILIFTNPNSFAYVLFSMSYHWPIMSIPYHFTALLFMVSTHQGKLRGIIIYGQGKDRILIIYQQKLTF